MANGFDDSGGMAGGNGADQGSGLPPDLEKLVHMVAQQYAAPSIANDPMARALGDTTGPATMDPRDPRAAGIMGPQGLSDMPPTGVSPSSGLPTLPDSPGSLSPGRKSRYDIDLNDPRYVGELMSSLAKGQVERPPSVGPQGLQPGGGVMGGQQVASAGPPALPGGALAAPGAGAPPPAATPGLGAPQTYDESGPGYTARAQVAPMPPPEASMLAGRPGVGPPLAPGDRPSTPLPPGMLQQPQYPGQRYIYPGQGLPPVPWREWSSADIPSPANRAARGLQVTGPITRLAGPPAPGLTAYPQPEGTRSFGAEGVFDPSAPGGTRGRVVGPEAGFAPSLGGAGEGVAGAPAMPSLPQMPGPVSAQEARQELKRDYPSMSSAEMEGLVPQTMRAMTTARVNNYKLQLEQYKTGMEGYKAATSTAATKQRLGMEREGLDIKQQHLDVAKDHLKISEKHFDYLEKESEKRGGRSDRAQYRSLLEHYDNLEYNLMQAAPTPEQKTMLDQVRKTKDRIQKRLGETLPGFKEGGPTGLTSEENAQVAKIHPEAVQYLLAHPDTADQFDKKFNTPGLAQKIIAGRKTAPSEDTSED